jgi:hypothetical protein
MDFGRRYRIVGDHLELSINPTRIVDPALRGAFELRSICQIVLELLIDDR